MACSIVRIAQRAFRSLLRRQPVHVVVIVRRASAGVGHGVPLARCRVREANRGLVRRRAREQPVQVVVGVSGDRSVEVRYRSQVAVVVVLARLTQGSIG